MASIPTGAFSAPRVRWVMQKKLLNEQQKSQAEAEAEARIQQQIDKDTTNQDEMSSAVALKTQPTTSRSRHESFSDQKAKRAEALDEPSVKSIFLQRIPKLKITLPVESYLTATIKRPDLRRSFSQTGDAAHDLEKETNFDLTLAVPNNARRNISSSTMDLWLGSA